MITIDPKETALAKVQSLFQGAIAPRPIAFASTVDLAGSINLSPFSFFNIFSNRPPILIFSAARSGRDNSTKHTYENVLDVPEVVINIVSFSMVEQASLASVAYPKGVNEFIKTGLTPVPSQRVKPPRVGESPASFECIVKQVIPLGDQGGAGNLVICEVLLAHFKEEIFDDQGRIDPQKLDAVARMGNNYYCRAHGENVFIVPKPTDRTAIGYDQIPEPVRKSKVLTANDLARLGNIDQLPEWDGDDPIRKNPLFKIAMTEGEESIHRLAQKMIREGRIEDAWKVLLAFH
jgi:flavin reductase (DIM6/NTAB) family NADH-FMN oxidoreductase RutF